MARFLSQTLTLTRTSSSSSSSSSAYLSISPRILTQRHGSNQSGKSQLIEVNLDSSSPSNDDVELLGIRKLEDVIHSIIVKRSAPDWLPFMPGSSYWVPPRPSRPYGLVEMLGRLTNPLTNEESLSLSTVRGWPSSSYFIQGTSSTHGVPVVVKVDEMVDKESDNVPWSEEEE